MKTPAERFPRAFVIVNTRAGGHEEAKIRSALDATLGQAGIDWEWVLREKGQSRRDLTHEAIRRGFPLIVAAGGDGTIAKCADEASRDDVVLGILPTGTGNLIARELGIPMDVEQAAKVLIEGEPRRVDAMEVDGKRRCFSHVSMGTYSRIASLDTPEDKKLLGRLAYLRLLWREVRAGRSWRFRMWQDGVYSRRRASLVLAANVGSTGLPGLEWRDGAAPDDGVIDLCIVRAKTASEYLTLLWDALRGRHEQNGAMEYAEIRDSLKIETSNGLPLRGDGKQIGKGSVEIKVLRGAIQVMAPAAGSC